MEINVAINKLVELRDLGVESVHVVADSEFNDGEVGTVDSIELNHSLGAVIKTSGAEH